MSLPVYEVWLQHCGSGEGQRAHNTLQCVEPLWRSRAVIGDDLNHSCAMQRVQVCGPKQLRTY